MRVCVCGKISGLQRKVGLKVFTERAVPCRVSSAVAKYSAKMWEAQRIMIPSVYM